jgi:hypothetical protein
LASIAMAVQPRARCGNGEPLRNTTRTTTSWNRMTVQ